MSIAIARKYINELHKRQSNPYLWPDFLTGLPDKTAVMRKVAETLPKLSQKCIVVVRIAEIEPYMVKYGTDRHAEIIQWAAAILKTSADHFGGFVGVFDIHEFVAIIRKDKTQAFIQEAQGMFEKKSRAFYSNEDRRAKTVISFKESDRQIKMGLMRFEARSSEDLPPMPSAEVLPALFERGQA